MKYGKIEGVDKPISKLVLGTDFFFEDKEGELYQLIDAYFEMGGNAFDLAHIYGGGAGQRIVGRWMKSRNARDKVVLLDKGCHPYGHPRVSPKYIEEDLNENLARLGIEQEDVFVLHRDDPKQDIAPLLDSLNEQIAKGKISAFGASNWTTTRLDEALSYAKRHGLRGFSLSSNNLSLAEPNEPMWEGCVSLGETELLWHRRNRFPLFAWSPAARGWFAGVRDPDVTRVYENDENHRRLERAKILAKRHGATPHQIALAYVLCQDFPTWAIIGARTIDELRQNVQSLEIELSKEEMLFLKRG